MVSFVEASLSALSDPERAKQMAAYMKTDMPFYGVPTPELKRILFDVYRDFPVENNRDYRQAILALWDQPHREEKHAAVRLARRYQAFVVLENLDVYEQLIVEGAWWDFVDDVAANLVGSVFLVSRTEVGPIMDTWVDDNNLWRRRSAILSHLKHKEATDVTMLFDFCLRRAHEKEFFIRKAIGWVLREYAKTDAPAVKSFVGSHRDRWSGLTYREAMKHL